MKDNPRADLGKLVLRLALGLLILLHGIAKLRGGLDQITGLVESHGLPGFVAYGALVGEVLAPLLVLAGFYARIGGALDPEGSSLEPGPALYPMLITTLATTIAACAP